MTSPRLLLSALIAAVALGVSSHAQLRVVPIEGRGGELPLELLLRRLGTVGTFMMTTAHPDDENNALLAELSYGEGMRTTLVTATRGDGGQNEIGPELFDSLAVLRSEELLAAHKFDGTEQYFTRAVDFGYSFSIEETLQKWGREEILADYVRHIRTIRPDVIAGFVFDGAGGGQHHQASARLTADAFRAAADPAQFPDQIQQGLKPWQAKKYYYTLFSGFGPNARPIEPAPGVCIVDGNKYDAALGRTYAQLGGEARSMHKCQGMSQLLPLPGRATRAYMLHDTVIPGQREQRETSVFDGVDTRLASLAAFAGSTPPGGLWSALAAIETRVRGAQSALRARGPAATTPDLLAGLSEVTKLRGQLASLGLSDVAHYEIDFRLRQKQRQFEQALVEAHGIYLEALADDGLVTAGQRVTVEIVVPNRGDAPVSVTTVSLTGFDGTPAGCARGTAGPGGMFTCEATATIPAGAKLSDRYFRQLPGAARYVFEPDVAFGAPFRPTPFRASVTLDVSGTAIPVSVPVQFRYEDIFAGEKRVELTVVPKFAVRVTPEVAIVPLAREKRQPSRDIRVTVLNASKGPATAEAALVLPQGWNAMPASAPVRFTREDESVTVRFAVTPPTVVAPSAATIKAIVREAGATYDQGYEVVEYPHTTRRHVLAAPEVTVKVLDVKVAPNLTVGYVMGVGDEVPPAIEQLGAKLELIDRDTLAWGDLSVYDVIVTGVRAYERRDDLRANNHRLLEYARQGGTVIVQYNKFEFNQAQYGPYPVKVSQNRVTDERAPIDILMPHHPVFNTPNRIDGSAWDGWVQERGLYFLGEKDAQYVDLLESEDPFPYNKGPKRGALVEARVGQGRWIYVGLNLWRQLPAGTDGAYKLMANLLSLGQLPSGSHQR